MATRRTPSVQLAHPTNQLINQQHPPPARSRLNMIKRLFKKKSKTDRATVASVDSSDSPHPYVNIQTPSGALTVSYSISTPEDPNARNIDPSLDTVIFLHPIFNASEIWHQQLQNPELRRYNLVTIDMRSHGRTTGNVKKGFGFVDAAQDVALVMNALDLPPSFFVGVSMGSSIAIHMAVYHPQKVKGLFCISPLSASEPEKVAAGRAEIWECWEAGITAGDDELLEMAIVGARQLGYNSVHTPMIDAIVKAFVAHALRLWVSPQGVQNLQHMSVDLFIKRAALPKDKLANIGGKPVTFLHAGADVAYPVEFLREKQRDFEEAGNKVDFHSIEGAPHFSNFTHPDQVNFLLHAYLATNGARRTDGLTPVNTISPFAYLFVGADDNDNNE